MTRLYHVACLFAVALASGLPPATPAPNAEPVPKFSPFPDLLPLPVIPVVPPVPPNPNVDPVVPRLTAEMFYVVKDDAPFLLFASPPGLVSIAKDVGPLRIRGKFIDGNGRVETRTIAAKNVAIIEAVPGKSGRVELIFVPAAEVDESKAIRRMVDVNTAPQPPPPEPKPVDPKPEPVTSFRVLFVCDPGVTLPLGQSSVTGAKSVRDYLNANCTKDGADAGWRQWYKDTDATDEHPTIKSLWEAVQPKLTTIPCMVVEVNGKAEIIPFPGSPTEAITTFKKYNGGK